MKKIWSLIDKIYFEHAEINHLPGFAFAVVDKDQILHTGYNGYACIETKTLVSSSTFFRIASMTKSITAMAILQLRDAGRLRLDDLIKQYIPEIKYLNYKLEAECITIRSLLTHTAGFPQDDPWGDRKLDLTNEALTDLLKEGISFSTVPGTAYEYSNLGYVLLGLIITRVSGMPFQQYINKNIFTPLKLEQITWEYSQKAENQIAQGYQWYNKNWHKEEMLHDGSFGSMGGLLSSLNTFAKYMMFHLSAGSDISWSNDAPFKKSTILEMHQPWRLIEALPCYSYPDGKKDILVGTYGYGLHHWRDRNGHIYIKHNGGLPGFGCGWVIMPEFNIGVVLLTNKTYSPLDNVNLKVLNVLINSSTSNRKVIEPSAILITRQKELLELLPTWNNALDNPIFSDNFFKDNKIEDLRAKTIKIFEQAGEITETNKLIAKNQLRGYFIMEGRNKNIQIYFTLTPEKIPRIQYLTINLIEENTSPPF